MIFVVLLEMGRRLRKRLEEGMRREWWIYDRMPVRYVAKPMPDGAWEIEPEYLVILREDHD